MAKKSYRLILVFILLLALGCASSKAVKTVRTPKFPKFTSKMTSQSEPSDISIAIINPTYAVEYEIGEEDEWSKLFRTSLGDEIEQMIINRGFNVVGPFGNIDEMTFPQKKQSNLVLMPVINIKLKSPTPETVTKTSWGAALLGGSNDKVAYVWKGPCTAQGYISLEIFEPLSQQKMWFKRMDIKPIQVDCTAENPEDFKAAYYDAYAQLLETSYNKTLSKADAYFSREEMELIDKQATELRSKKVY